MKQMLIIGIGNPARGDDSLGWMFLEEIMPHVPQGTVLEYRSQLQVEDAEFVKDFRSVVFVDATETVYPAGFQIMECRPSASYYYSSHIQSPEAILYLSQVLYGALPDATVVSITGYGWELGEKPGPDALANLKRALSSFVRNHINHKKQTIKPEKNEI